jgi:hypothetical protein
LAAAAGLTQIGRKNSSEENINSGEKMIPTEIPIHVRAEYPQDSERIDKYDAEILEIENKIKMAADEEVKNALMLERNSLMSEREELAKYISENTKIGRKHIKMRFFLK